jgi:hypothetical protein
MKFKRSQEKLGNELLETSSSLSLGVDNANVGITCIKKTFFKLIAV